MTGSSGSNLLYAAHVPPGDGPFPTIVALHGWGASAHDLLGLAPILHGGEALMLCPEGPVGFYLPQGLIGHGWFPLSEGRPPEPEEFEKGRQALADWLDFALARYPVDRRKLVLMGFSQGGVMAYDLALREPDRFAGVVALSSWLPPDLGMIEARPEHATLPTFVAHGTKDPMIPVERAQESRDALIQLGVPVVFREYDMEHEVRPEALRDLVEWLQTKVLSPIQLL